MNQKNLKAFRKLKALGFLRFVFLRFGAAYFVASVGVGVLIKVVASEPITYSVMARTIISNAIAAIVFGTVFWFAISLALRGKKIERQ